MNSLFARLRLELEPMKLLLCLSSFFACLALSSCRSPQVPQADLTWPVEGVTEVRAYRINWAEEFGQVGILTGEGELRATRIPQEGIVLNTQQTAKLHHVITGEHAEYASAACFNPHHAFVFFDADGKILGCLDVCFKCSAYVGSHDGFAEYLDLDGLRELLGELEIPISNPEW